MTLERFTRRAEGTILPKSPTEFGKRSLLPTIVQAEGDGTERSLIIGAGPAGLTAAYELSRLGVPSVVYEQDGTVGGLARTASYKGYRFDLGGHRFFTKVPLVQDVWTEILGDDLLVRPRLSRIYYDGHFFDYPLTPMNALRGLGPIEAIRIGMSFALAQLFPDREERTFEQWVSNRFGRRLYEIFFKTYTEKVWGMPCSEIGADWAAQRIKNLDLFTAVKNALVGSARRGGEVVTTLIDQFRYPRLGPGMMWERCAEILAERGCETHLDHLVTRISHRDGRVVSVTVRDSSGAEREEFGSHVLSSMPIRTLVHALDPPPPQEVIDAADRLRYRDFLTVVLLVDRPELFPDNWIYIHSPTVKLGRIQNFKNWSPEMVPDPSKTALGLEYFVQEGDELWSAPDEELIGFAGAECERIGLIDVAWVIDGSVVRSRKAYPVYDTDYRELLWSIRAWLDKLPNLQLIGRNGQHRYNNQDHSMLTGIYAARNIAGADYQIWDVNVEQEYHEEVQSSVPTHGERLVPGAVDARLDLEFVRSVFARYDAVALGAALALVLSAGLFAMTAVLLLRGDEPLGPNLSLLGNYLIGYSVSWPGALLGAAEAGLGGFGFGFVLAWLINVVVGLHEAAFRRKLELSQTLDPFEERR